MKVIYTLCALVFCTLLAKSQTVIPYVTVVKTEESNIEGLLYRLDSDVITMAKDDKMLSIPISDIRSIKVRSPKKEHEFVQFLKYDPWSDDNFEKNANGLKVRKWAKKDPTLGEEIGVHLLTGILNATGNVLAAPIRAINPKIAYFKIDGKAENYKASFDELKYFSVHYQFNPDTEKELKRIKQISANFKP